MKAARVIYTEDWNGKEGIIVEVKTDDGWEMQNFFPFVAKVGAEQVESENEKQYVHWRVLRVLGEMIEVGYKIEKIDI